MRTGDPSLKAVKHPRFGKILIAKRNLPRGYYVAWWGLGLRLAAEGFVGILHVPNLLSCLCLFRKPVAEEEDSPKAHGVGVGDHQGHGGRSPI